MHKSGCSSLEDDAVQFFFLLKHYWCFFFLFSQARNGKVCGGGAGILKLRLTYTSMNHPQRMTSRR